MHDAEEYSYLRWRTLWHSPTYSRKQNKKSRTFSAMDMTEFVSKWGQEIQPKSASLRARNRRRGQTILILSTIWLSDGRNLTEIVLQSGSLYKINAVLVTWNWTRFAKADRAVSIYQTIFLFQNFRGDFWKCKCKRKSPLSITDSGLFNEHWSDRL